MWLLNNLSSFVKNVIIVKHNTSAIGKICPSVVLYCFLKYLRECQFFKEIVIFQKSDPFFVLFQTARTLLILTLHWKAMLFWKCLYPYFNFKWLFDVATEVKILLWHTYWHAHCLIKRQDCSIFVQLYQQASHIHMLHDERERWENGFHLHMPWCLTSQKDHEEKSKQW